MKKLCFVILSLFAAQSIYALPVGNPSEASLFYANGCREQPLGCDFFTFGVGFYGNYVFNRHLETVQDRNIDTTKIVTNAGYLVVNFWETLDVFSALGTSRISLNTSLRSFNSIDPLPLFEVESGTSFSYTVGARATLWECGCFSLGFLGEYFETRPNIKRLYIASGAVSYPDDELRTHYSEWQFATGVSYRFSDFFIPYFAFQYAHAYWKFGNGQNFVIDENTTTFLYNMRNRKNLGYTVGLTWAPFMYEKFIISAEARFLNETAFSVNAQLRF